jgi:hypothetical protein
MRPHHGQTPNIPQIEKKKPFSKEEKPASGAACIVVT